MPEPDRIIGEMILFQKKPEILTLVTITTWPKCKYSSERKKKAIFATKIRIRKLSTDSKAYQLAYLLYTLR